MTSGTTQYSLVFHDTVPMPLEQLEKGRKKAVRQKDIILHIFRCNPDKNFTPPEIQARLSGELMLMTSVRRCITDLTKEGRLMKCDYSESRDGNWKTLNRTWKYNSDYVAPLTYKGHKVYTADEINSMCITDVEFE